MKSGESPGIISPTSRVVLLNVLLVLLTHLLNSSNDVRHASLNSHGQGAEERRGVRSRVFMHRLTDIEALLLEEESGDIRQ